MDFGIVGAGLIGRRRAEDIAALGHRVVLVADINIDRANQVAALSGARSTADWHDVVAATDVQAVVVATINKVAAQACQAALKAGKHVLCEKPLGRNAEEARQILAARPAGVVLKTGFNYRYYPAIREAHRLVEQGAIGPLHYLRVNMGHGGHPGYQDDWKMNRDLCGGGVLMDLGVHCIDLSRWFLGELVHAESCLLTAFWPGVEDNAFILFRSATGKAASVHVSLTQWENTFNLELGGADGLIRVSGRSGFYGAQRLRLVPRWSWRGSSDGRIQVHETEYPPEDVSFRDELSAFLGQIAASAATSANGNGGDHDGYRVTEIVDLLYRSAGAPVDLCNGHKPK